MNRREFMVSASAVAVAAAVPEFDVWETVMDARPAHGCIMMGDPVKFTPPTGVYHVVAEVWGNAEQVGIAKNGTLVAVQHGLPNSDHLRCEVMIPVAEGDEITMVGDETQEGVLRIIS